MRNRDRLKGKAKMRADLEAKSKKSLPHQEAPNIGKYKKAATKLSSKTYRGLTAKRNQVLMRQNLVIRLIRDQEAVSDLLNGRVNVNTSNYGHTPPITR